MLPGRKSAFRAGFWSDCYRENTGPAFGRPEGRFRCFPGSSPTKIRPGRPIYGPEALLHNIESPAARIRLPRRCAASALRPACAAAVPAVAAPFTGSPAAAGAHAARAAGLAAVPAGHATQGLRPSAAWIIQAGRAHPPTRRGGHLASVTVITRSLLLMKE